MYERILVLLDENNLSARKLEIKLNFAKNTISRIRDHAPSIDKIAKIADYFNVSMEYLFYGKEEKEKRNNSENPITQKNEEDLLQMLHTFKDIRTQTIFVGRVSVIAEQMLEEKDKWAIAN